MLDQVECKKCQHLITLDVADRARGARPLSRDVVFFRKELNHHCGQRGRGEVFSLSLEFRRMKRDEEEKVEDYFRC